MQHVFFLVGPPSCGKTNPGQALEGLGCHRLVMSDMIKAYIQSNESFGQTVECLMAKGDLIPDHMVIEVFSQNLADLDQGIKNLVVDGFPRTKNQFCWLRSYLLAQGIPWTIIHIDTSNDNCRLRNNARQAAGVVRTDHTVIDSRLIAYDKTMPEMLGCICSSSVGNFVRVNGNQSKHAVRDEVISTFVFATLTEVA